ncbi:hypothetical protein IS481_13535 [Caldimonas thermodepolymerans]|jgi:hypothetical protein|uniref:Uncharacterized protein n=1 Tax=Caldimonas thermodepolymerans TaxID=215580 RepID=A0A2S5T9Q9_9BURK|nr:hypothetical protein [Caldimonas thermodepolymerans]PPE71740.1 hypothetical protein C1702_01750 [Caldimonas thermodepolymerans]QPC30766.1 hypothetical protein IS481_13535 [Caldimonas thermodepolymerans]RDI02614.1 hypothetical protein DES46_10240 [Caldimonas thermodepolymerans]TCP08858.1 hypothetical protein EV676_102368 [Caldimonas thermodepolymerans]UZG47177.1 hypothetical protein ONS87_14665 [Caldimonas thermodepolymerans]
MHALNAPASRDDNLLEPVVLAVEARLQALGQALQQRDSAAVEQCASDLHRALTEAVETFRHAARSGGITPALRQRLVRATGQVAAQRESLARATAALDRAMDVLLPRTPDVVYSPGLAAYGSGARSQHSASA